MPNLDEIAREAAEKWLRENCICCQRDDGTFSAETVGGLAAIIRAVIDQAAPGIRAEVLREAVPSVLSEINVFQDIVGWQRGESRNRLIGDIAEKAQAELHRLAEAEKGET